MKTRILAAALLCLVAGIATADVTNEVAVGFLNDVTKKVTDASGNDITGELRTIRSEFDLRYTHYFSPLRDDEKPYELHRFYQHPPSLSIGLTTYGYAQRDSRVPIGAGDGALREHAGAGRRALFFDRHGAVPRAWRRFGQGEDKDSRNRRAGDGHQVEQP